MRVRLWIISIWTIIDPIYYTFTRLTYIGKQETKYRSNILRVRLTRFKGRSLTLSDGTVINTNDLLIKIHLHNVRLLKDLRDIKNDTKKALFIYRCVKDSLPDLAEYVGNHPNCNEIKGVIGITMLNRGCERLGFEPVMITNPWYKGMKWVLLLPIYCLSVSKISIQNLKKHDPYYLLMTKEKLLENKKSV